MGIIEDKKAHRAEARKIWSSLDRRSLEVLGDEVSRTLTESSLWQQADRILLYLAMKREIPLHLLFEESRRAGKEIYAPRVYGRKMLFHRLPGNPDEAVEHSDMGMAEPLTSLPVYKAVPGRKDLILVPGLFFSRDGYRMGRGGGYYDRFLSERSTDQFAMGIAFPGVLGEVPREEHDVRLDGLCCGGRIYSFGPVGR